MTDRYAVVGNPIAHSKSPQIHTAFAAQTGQDLSYERLLVPLNGFPQALESFQEQGGRGVNVTTPFKLAAYSYATEHSIRAKKSGAVNTLKFQGEQVIGDNTDGVGLCQDIVCNLGFVLAGKRILLIGAGGAARGVIGALLDEKPESLAITNRTPSKALALVQQFSDEGNVLALHKDELLSSNFDLIINASSASLNTELPDIPTQCFGPDCLAYDMVYSTGLTPFLALAAQLGATTANGIGMLVEQAAESFTFWRGVRPETSTVLAQMRQVQL